MQGGDALALIGLSGQTEFPHLHLGVRRDGRPIDPFDPDGPPSCGASAQNPDPRLALWKNPVPYTPGGLIEIGITTEVPAFDAVKSGLPQRPVLPAKAPALVVWAHLFGARQGDTLTLALTGPQGAILSESVALTRTQARVLRAAGKRLRGPAGWPAGDYTGTASLTRKGKPLSERSLTLRVEG